MIMLYYAYTFHLCEKETGKMLYNFYEMVNGGKRVELRCKCMVYVCMFAFARALIFYFVSYKLVLLLLVATNKLSVAFVYT